MPLWACFWCSRQGEEWEHAVHHKRAHEGMFGVFEMRGRGGNMPDTTNTPTRRVCGVRRVRAPSSRLELHKHAHKGAFLVSDASLPFPSSQTSLPLHLCLERQQHALVGVFLVYDAPTTFSFHFRYFPF